jgi:thioesterase domain-containing protein/acyl carrier protein
MDSIPQLEPDSCAASILQSPTLATTDLGSVQQNRRNGDRNKCIHALFPEQVARTPDAVAVSCGDRELTYRELDDRSNQLAQELRELRIGPETLVAVCLDRSPELIVGLLGILKAGGAYVPMDPGYPPERLAFMLEDTQAQVLLTNRSLHPILRKTNAKTVYLEPDWRDIDHHSTVAPSNLIAPTNLAYAIYTSGSTGKPKGVLVEHAGMVNLVDQHRELYGTREGTRISQTANASFDSMGSEIWPALLSGAVLCIAYVFLNNLPLTPNGKLDRRALPEPRLSRSQFVEPVTPLQRELAKIWQNVLDIERVGLEDDFFELGGHSLLAINVVSEIKRILGRRLPVATLLQAPTIEKLAAKLEAKEWRRNRSLLVAIQPHGSRPPFFVVHGLAGDVMFYRELAQHIGRDQPLYAIQSEGSDGGPIRYRSIETIARYYVAEMRRAQPCGPYYLGGYCIGGLIAFEMARQVRMAGEQVGCLPMFEPDPPPYRGTLRRRMQLVLDETAVLTLSERLRYFTGRIAQKAKWKVSELQSASTDLVERLYDPLNQGSGIKADRLQPIKFPVGRMLVRARKRYFPRPYPGRITIFVAPVSEYRHLADDHDWSAFAEGGVEIHEIPGEHLTIFESQYAPAFAEKLESCLRAAHERSSGGA